MDFWMGWAGLGILFFMEKRDSISIVERKNIRCRLYS